MSVGFGMAKSTLATESSLTKLSAINPQQYKMMKQLAVETMRKWMFEC